MGRFCVVLMEGVAIVSALEQSEKELELSH